MKVFIDTSYIIAVLRKKDTHHATAVAATLRYRGTFVTTEYVLIEAMNYLNALPFRSAVSRTVESLRRNPGTLVVPASTELLDDGIALFSARSDKDWGLTDCISFVVMEREGVTEALTSDRHFEQAGFKALLRSEA